jgi:hypothetical protein
MHYKHSKSVNNISMRIVSNDKLELLIALLHVICGEKQLILESELRA